MVIGSFSGFRSWNIPDEVKLLIFKSLSKMKKAFLKSKGFSLLKCYQGNILYMSFRCFILANTIVPPCR